MTNSHEVHRDNYQDALGRSIAAHLNDTANSLPNDISERLKAARMMALSKRKVIKLQVASSVVPNGGTATLHMGGDDRSFWNRIASLVPLLALIAGLLTIAVVEEQRRTNELAEVDAALLTDELPPAAYTDPGFAQYLNLKRRE